MAYQKPKGTIDFFPEEMSIRQQVFNTLSSAAQKFGFLEIESPAFESLQLLNAKSGEEINEQIFTLEKRSKEEFGLRFDLTVPMTRMFLDVQKQLPKPIKWFMLSRMWRYERPQAGRQREFYQLSAELFGSDKPEADAEIINLSIECLKSFGLTSKDFQVKLCNRKLIQGLLLQVLPQKNLDAAMRIIDKMRKISDSDFDKEMKAIGVKDIKALRKTLEIDSIEELQKLEKDGLAQEGFENLKAVYNLVDKKYVKLDLSIVRGLAYYTGTVFEAYDTEEKFRAIFGGGRYDKMVEQFGGESCAATGFGLGYSTLTLLLKDKNKLPKPLITVDYFIAPISDNERSEAIKLASKLRTKFSVDIDLMGRKFKKQLDYANSINAKNVIILGETEVKSKKLTVKDMKSGKETKKTVEQLLKA